MAERERLPGGGIFSAPRCRGSIVCAGVFHFRVRDGNGWVNPALTTGKPILLYHITLFGATVRHARYEKPFPFSLRLTKLLPPTMMWSKTSMSSVLPASTICSVTVTSSGLGAGSPDG